MNWDSPVLRIVGKPRSLAPTSLRLGSNAEKEFSVWTFSPYVDDNLSIDSVKKIVNLRAFRPHGAFVVMNAHNVQLYSTRFLASVAGEARYS
jgi:hypothetical protein